MFFHFHLMSAQLLITTMQVSLDCSPKSDGLFETCDSLNDIWKFIVRKQSTFIYVKSDEP